MPLIWAYLYGQWLHVAVVSKPWHLFQLRDKLDKKKKCLLTDFLIYISGIKTYSNFRLQLSIEQ